MYPEYLGYFRGKEGLVLIQTYAYYQSQGQALCLTESPSQLKCWNCTASSKGEVLLATLWYLVAAPDQGVQRGPHLGVDCSESYRQAKTPRVQAILIPFHSIPFLKTPPHTDIANYAIFSCGATLQPPASVSGCVQCPVTLFL